MFCHEGFTGHNRAPLRRLCLLFIVRLTAGFAILAPCRR